MVFRRTKAEQIILMFSQQMTALVEIQSKDRPFRVNYLPGYELITHELKAILRYSIPFFDN